MPSKTFDILNTDKMETAYAVLSDMLGDEAVPEKYKKQIAEIIREVLRLACHVTAE